MSTKKPTWIEKLNDSTGLPKVEKITDKMSKHWGTDTVFMPAPIEVDEIMRKVPTGKLKTINEICAALAKKHKATIGCPMTTSIFLDCSPRRRRTKTTWRKRHDALLANVENWRDLE